MALRVALTKSGERVGAANSILNRVGLAETSRQEVLDWRVQAKNAGVDTAQVDKLAAEVVSKLEKAEGE
jgi:hypothetical protein